MHRRWILHFFTATITVIVFVSLFNYGVNPYNTFDLKPGVLNGYKKRVLSDRMTKFYEAVHLEPKTVMMGTSRIGLFNADLLKKYAPSPIYNLSLAGSSIKEQSLYLKSMIERFEIKTIVWSMDFFAFNPSKPLNQSFEEGRLKETLYWRDIQLSLLSFKTVEKSINTIKDSLKNSFDPSCALFEKNEYRTMQGQAYTAEEVALKIKTTMQMYAASNEFLHSSAFKDPHSIEAGIEHVRQIRDLCLTHQIDLRIYLSPVYAKHQKMIYDLSLKKSYERWKEAMAGLMPYTDFSTYNTITTEPLNFRDSSHVISDIGALIFGRVFHDTAMEIPHDFGLSIPYREAVTFTGSTL